MQSVTDVRTCCIQLQNYKPKRHNITMGPNHGDMDLDLNLDLRVGDLDLDLDLRVGDLDLDLRPEDLTTSLLSPSPFPSMKLLNYLSTIRIRKRFSVVKCILLKSTKMVTLN